MTDPAIIPTVIISIISIIGGILLKLHLKKCKCANIECKCDESKSNDSSPTFTNKIIKKFFSNSNINNGNTNNIDNNINNNNIVNNDNEKK
jgi:hypothetical protein